MEIKINDRTFLAERIEQGWYEVYDVHEEVAGAKKYLFGVSPSSLKTVLELYTETEYPLYYHAKGDDPFLLPGTLYCCEDVGSPYVSLSNKIYDESCVLRSDTGELCLCGDKMFDKKYDADMAGGLISSGDVKYVFYGSGAEPGVVAMPKGAYDALDESDKKDVYWFNL